MSNGGLWITAELNDPEGVTDAGNGIPRTHLQEQAVTHRRKELIPDQVAVEIVQRLEPIHIQLYQAAGRTLGSKLHSSLHGIVQASLVECFSLNVVVDQPGKGRLGVDPSGYVLYGALD